MPNDTDIAYLRDAQHAYIFVNSTNFDTAPKTKFLYHVLFEINEEAKKRFSIQDSNLEILSVLANAVSLPSYTSSVDTLNQYNRKKKYQTKIDYKDVGITFFDDNVGISRSLLESYYKYYFSEGNNTSVTDVSPRNAADTRPRRFGLDNQTTTPFFDYIKIFQISKKKWFCYTLVNPIITQWSHDELSYAEGSAIMENKISVAYEAVLYTTGSVNIPSSGGNPPGFGQVGYDLTPSPLNTRNSASVSPKGINNTPKSVDDAAPLKEINDFQKPVPTQPAPLSPNSVLKDIIIPLAPGETITPPIARPTAQTYDTAQLKRRISSNPQLANTLTTQALATGAYSSDWGPSNFSEFANLDTSVQQSIQNDVIAQIDSNIKIQKIANRIAKA